MYQKYKKILPIIKKAGMWLYTMAAFAALALTASAEDGGNNNAVIAANGGGDLAQTELVKGTKRLISDVINISVGIGIGVGILFIIYCAIRKSAADEQDSKQWAKRIVGTFVAIGIIVVAAGIVQTFVKYYGGAGQVTVK